MDEKISEVNNSNEAAQMFKAVKQLNRKRIQNSKVPNEEGRLLTNLDEILKLTTKFMEKNVNYSSVPTLNPFKGDPIPLTHPITKVEVA